MKPNANPTVVAWLDQQVAETLYLTVASLAELLAGIEILPDGKRKEGLAAAVAEIVERLFGVRVLPLRSTRRDGVCPFGQPRPDRGPHHLRGGRPNCLQSRPCMDCRGDTGYGVVCGHGHNRHQPVGSVIKLQARRRCRIPLSE